MRLHRVKRFEQQEKQTNRVREIICQWGKVFKTKKNFIIKTTQRKYR